MASRPKHIFDRAPEAYSTPEIEHILAVLRRGNGPNPSRERLLRRLARLEKVLPAIKQYTITQLLHRSAPITKKLIDEWPPIDTEPPDEEDEDKAEALFSEEEYQEWYRVRGDDEEYYVDYDDLACGHCDSCDKDFIFESSLRRDPLRPACDHKFEMCHCCVLDLISGQMTDEPLAWDGLYCPYCTLAISPKIVRRYLSPPREKEYVCSARHHPSLFFPTVVDTIWVSMYLYARLSSSKCWWFEKTAQLKNYQHYRYNDFAASLYLSSLADFQWCTSPTCHSGQVHPAGSSSPKVTCVDCKAVSCFTHQEPWETIVVESDESHSETGCAVGLEGEDEGVQILQTGAAT